MRYDDRLIEQIQQASDIVEIISQTIPLKRAGRNFKGNCPFHQEKTASFMVSAEKQIFHCFGCGQGGSVFAFLMRSENLTFPEAVKKLAERAHISLPENLSGKGSSINENDKFYEACQIAVDFYHKTYMHPEHGREARAYWKKRGFSEDLAKEFKIGWAPVAWRNLVDHLSSKGFRPESLIKSGLVQKSTQGGNYYDVFRGRLLFPIQNLQGKYVALGGRIIGQEEGPKYLNSPETPIFQKRRELFGLNLARKFISRDLPRILIVEGYLDFLRMYEKGFRYAGATLGTSLTPDHVRVLKRFAEEAIVVYDGDAAGEAATLRGLDVFVEGDMAVKIIRMPKGLDPDDFLRDQGAEAFQKLIDTAQDFFDFKMQVLLAKYNRRDSLGLVKITKEALETLGKVQNPVLVETYIKKMAGLLSVSEASVREQFSKTKKNAPKGMAAPMQVAEKIPTQKTKQDFQKAQDVEILLLALLMESPHSRGHVFEHVDRGLFQNEQAREFFDQIKEDDANHPLPFWLDKIGNEELKKKILLILSSDWTEEVRAKMLEDCLKQMSKKDKERKLAEIRRMISEAERKGLAQEVAALVEEYQSLLSS